MSGILLFGSELAAQTNRLAAHAGSVRSVEEQPSQSEPERCRRPGTLLHRQPRECLEEIDTDRPHRTDTPSTVPPGYTQTEFGIVSYEAPTANTGNTLHFLDLLFKVGVSERLDLELGYSPVTMRQRADRAGWLGATNNWYGRNFYLRSKIRLFGGPRKPLALSIAPILSVPISAGTGVEGGATLLFGAELTEWLSWELNGSLLYEEQELESSRIVHGVPCSALTARVFGPLKAFGEIYLEHPLSRSSTRWTGTADGGLLYLVTNDMQVDAGIYWGLSDALPRYTVFGGFSFRL